MLRWLPVVIVVVIGGCGGASDERLTDASTCPDYLRSSPRERAAYLVGQPELKDAPRREALVAEDLLRSACRPLIVDGRAHRTTLAQAYAGLLVVLKRLDRALDK